MALRGVSGDTDHDSPVLDDLEVLHVSQETWDQVHEARQTHLLGPRLH